MKKILLIATILMFSLLSCFDGINDAYDAKSGHVMVYIPGGTFSRDGVAGNDSTVSSFYMSQFEITRAQFVTVTGLADPSDTALSPTSDCPVQKVSWYHSLVFCNRLSMLEGKTPVYTISGSTNPSDWGTVPTSGNGTWNSAAADWNADGYRLPTEMEWMWAAMGGSSDSRGSDLVGGVNTGGYTKGYAGSIEAGTAYVNIGSYTWYFLNSGDYGGSSNRKAHIVGSKIPNEFGLYDMSGNVWEWCWDWSAAYPVGARTDYTGGSGSVRVLRGGSFGTTNTEIAIAQRTSLLPYLGYDNDGFRVVHR